MQVPLLIILGCVATLALSAPSRAEDSATSARPPRAATAKTQKFQNLNVSEFEKLRANTNNVVLDVRTKREYSAGHMPGALNIDVTSSDFEKKVEALDPQKTYLVHCAAGVRSAKACRKLGELHFSHLYNLEGGFRAWENAGNEPVR